MLKTIFYTLFYTIKGTPPVVWLLLAYILFKGTKAMRPSITPIYKIAIMPTVFLVLSLNGLTKTLTGANISIWITGLFIGSVIGFLYLGNIKIKADKIKHLVSRPGTKATLFIALGIFSVKYYFGYKLVVHPELLQHFEFNIARIGISACLSGLSVGRTINLFWKYKKEDHTPLKA